MRVRGQAGRDLSVNTLECPPPSALIASRTVHPRGLKGHPNRKVQSSASPSRFAPERDHPKGKSPAAAGAPTTHQPVSVPFKATNSPLAGPAPRTRAHTPGEELTPCF